MPRFTSLVLASSLVALGPTALGACSTGDSPGRERELGEAPAAARTSAVADFDRVVPWGAGEGAIGWRAPAVEFRGDGPSGIAVAPDGRVVVVDRLNRRLVAVDEEGLAPLHAVPEDAEHLAFDAVGASVVFSPYRARAWVFTATGSAAGELAAPRLVGDVARIALGPSRRIELTTAFQERFVLGSPAAALGEADVVRSKREGAIEASSDGPALVGLRGDDGEVTLRAVEDGRRSAGDDDVVAKLGAADAVRVLGRVPGLVAVVLEHVAQPDEALVVTRELVVVDAATGAVAARKELPVGAWTPRESIALGGSPPAVAVMVPQADGLRVVRIDVARMAARGGAK